MANGSPRLAFWSCQAWVGVMSLVWSIRCVLRCVGDLGQGTGVADFGQDFVRVLAEGRGGPANGGRCGRETRGWARLSDESGGGMFGLYHNAVRLDLGIGQGLGS